jgi:hypothetical protein
MGALFFAGQLYTTIGEFMSKSIIMMCCFLLDTFLRQISNTKSSIFGKILKIADDDWLHFLSVFLRQIFFSMQWI